MLMQNVVRLSDRFLDRENPESIDRQGRLKSCIALVSIFYATLSIGFCKFSELEKRHRVYHPDPNVAFELMIAPKEHPVESAVMPPPTSFDEGSVNVGGTTNATASDTKQDIPAIKAKEEPPKDEPVILTHNLPVDKGAPVATVTTNKIASKPVSTTDDTTRGQVHEDNGTGTDKNGTGIGINGDGQGTAVGAGNDPFDAGGKQISTTISEPRPMANIAPYRKDMLVRLAAVWRPAKKNDTVVVLIRIAKDGTLLGAEVLGSSSKKAEKAALVAIESTEFAPLPDWFQGEDMPFKLTLDAQQL